MPSWKMATLARNFGIWRFTDLSQLLVPPPKAPQQLASAPAWNWVEAELLPYRVTWSIQWMVRSYREFDLQSCLWETYPCLFLAVCQRAPPLGMVPLSSLRSPLHCLRVCWWSDDDQLRGQKRHSLYSKPPCHKRINRQKKQFRENLFSPCSKKCTWNEQNLPKI